jgi:hypothetical protein
MLGDQDRHVIRPPGVRVMASHPKLVALDPPDPDEEAPEPDEQDTHPPWRQTLPLDIGLSELNQAIIYIPPAGYRRYDSSEEIPIIGGASTCLFANGSVQTSLLFETVYHPEDGLMFMVASGGEASKEPYLIRGTTVIVPPADPNGIITRGYVTLASLMGFFESETELDAEIDAYLYRYIDTTTFNRQLCRAYAKMTWVYDRFNALPYLRFLGPMGSAKTRMMEVTGRICYRGTALAGATSAAPVFRLMDMFHGTLLLDEADFQKSDMYSDITKILNVGYKRGNPIVRCDKDNNPVPYDPYGPKILTTRGRFNDASLESRCITIETHVKQDVRADIPFQLPDQFYVEAQELRNKLLTWRFDTYEKIRVDESKLRGLLEPRMIEIAAPLFAVTEHEPKFQQQLKSSLERTSTERRRESPEAIFVQAIEFTVKKKAEKETKAGERSSSSYILRVAEVGQAASELRMSHEPESARSTRPDAGEERPYYSAKMAGTVLRNLGFKPERTRRGFEFPITLDTLSDLVARYGAPDGAPVNQKIARQGLYDNLKQKADGEEER